MLKPPPARNAAEGESLPRTRFGGEGIRIQTWIPASAGMTDLPTSRKKF